MPFTNRGWLLARMAALLLLGSAAAGCQTVPISRASMFAPGDAPGEQSAPPGPDAGTGIVPVSATEEVLPPISTGHAYAPAPAPVTRTAPLAPPAQPAAPQAPCQSCQAARQPTRGLFWSVFRSPTTQEPPRLVPTPAAPCTGPGCSSAVMLPPVAAGGDFVPAQR